VPSVYSNLTYPDGGEIRQDLKLRTVPITGIVRFVPTGRHAPIQPYLGIGIAAINWHYSETGDFVDPSDSTIFSARYVDSGTEVAPLYLGGGNVPGNLTLVPSVEWPTINSVANLGDYADTRARMGANINAAVQSGGDPAVVAEAIAGALADEHPRIRYPVGKRAGRLAKLRSFLPARMFDRGFRKQFRLEV